MKSVLHIIYHARFGGIEQVVYDILKHQASTAQQAQDLLILKTEGEYLAQFGALPITVHHGAFKSGLDFAPSKILFIKEIIKSYDLVHFHMFHLPAIAVAVFSGTKTIYTEHGNFGFGRKVRWTDRVNHFFKGVFLRKKTNFITYNSNFTQAYAQKKYRLSHGRQSVVYNGIAFDNASTTTSRDFTANANTFNVGTISRLAGFKRVDRLISAFAEFALSKNDVKLYIGGDGVLKKALENQVRELNMEDKIKFTGYLKNAPDFMEQMNVCIFPSQNEPFGIVAVESLSRERPTLVFADGGGLVEIVGRFRPENIVPDEQALISRLEHYFENRGIVNNETAHIKKTLRDEFSIATMCASLHKIYSSL